MVTVTQLRAADTRTKTVPCHKYTGNSKAGKRQVKMTKIKGARREKRRHGKDNAQLAILKQN